VHTKKADGAVEVLLHLFYFELDWGTQKLT